MNWYINDISLAGQYHTPADFISDLKLLLAARNRNPLLKTHLFCSREIYLRPVSPSHNLQEAVISADDREFKNQVLMWLSKSGPFWEDSKLPVSEDYFTHNDHDITNHGLGEASRRVISGYAANTFSFANGGFDYSPITITHGLTDEPIATIEVTNQWRLNELLIAVDATAPIATNWRQMLDQLRRRFDHLNFVPSCIDPLNSEPFRLYVAERTFALLNVLNEYVENLTEAGTLSERNHELLSKHFSGEKAWFSDESISNKSKFRNELSFSDPSNPSHKEFCPWHGKIKSPQYRIHFEWPPKPGEKLRIFYIGPKITKS